MKQKNKSMQSKYARQSWIAYRKVLVATSSTKTISALTITSILMSAIGFILYLLVYPSGIILFEAMVWLIEAIAFAGITIALKLATVRTVRHRERYEILRLEGLAASVLAFIGLLVTIIILLKNVLNPQHKPTAVYLSLYPLASSLASLLMERVIHTRAHSLEIRLVSVRAITEKLRYDVFIELAGGVGIIASYALNEPLIETLIIVIVSLYVGYGLALVFAENMLYLIGPGPRSQRLEVRRRIKRLAGKLGYNIVRIRVEVYGTFAEAEIWIRLPGDVPLFKANNLAKQLARELLKGVPELLRVVVIPIPSTIRPRRKYSRSRHQQEPYKMRKQTE